MEGSKKAKNLKFRKQNSNRFLSFNFVLFIRQYFNFIFGFISIDYVTIFVRLRLKNTGD